jgi:hypothetical protein
MIRRNSASLHVGQRIGHYTVVSVLVNGVIVSSNPKGDGEERRFVAQTTLAGVRKALGVQSYRSKAPTTRSNIGRLRGAPALVGVGAGARAEREPSLQAAFIKKLPADLRSALNARDEAIYRREVGASDVFMVVAPSGVAVKSDFATSKDSGLRDLLRATGFQWFNDWKAWVRLGKDARVASNLLARTLEKSGLSVTRVGFNPRRMNGAKTVADPVAARELELYIENESALVAAPNSMGRMIMRNLAGMIARGTYDSTKAWKAWMPLADEGAKRYTREYGDRFGTTFSKATREMVANALAEAFESEVRTGAINLSTLLAPRANPRTRANPTTVPPLSGWRKDEYEYSAPVSGGRELVIRNFGITRPAWVPYVVFSDGHAAVAYKSLTGAALTRVSANRLGSESARYSHATPGAARALLAKAMSK